MNSIIALDSILKVPFISSSSKDCIIFMHSTRGNFSFTDFIIYRFFLDFPLLSFMLLGFSLFCCFYSFFILSQYRLLRIHSFFSRLWVAERVRELNASIGKTEINIHTLSSSINLHEIELNASPALALMKFWWRYLWECNEWKKPFYLFFFFC